MTKKKKRIKEKRRKIYDWGRKEKSTTAYAKLRNIASKLY